MNTPNLSLAPLVSAQAQKHVTVNEALARIDAATQLAVLDRDLATPPVNPVDGDRYLVASGAIADWQGHDGDIAAWEDATQGWLFLAPRPGWRVWLLDENALIVLGNDGWQAVSSGGGSTNPVSDGLLGVNTTADSVNRLAVKSDAALFSHDDVTPGNGDMRLTLNKATPSDDTSLTLQRAYSAHAQIGLTGDDNLHVKVSPNGTTFHEAMVVNRHDGVVTIPQRLRQNGGYIDCVGVSIPDDGVHVYDMPNVAPRMVFVMMHNNAFHGLVRNVGNVTSYILEMSRSGADIVIGSRQVYTGTTGADRKFTIATDESNAGRVYFENRLGGARVVTLIFLG